MSSGMSCYFAGVSRRGRVRVVTKLLKQCVYDPTPVGDSDGEFGSVVTC